MTPQKRGVEARTPTRGDGETGGRGDGETGASSRCHFQLHALAQPPQTRAPRKLQSANTDRYTNPRSWPTRRRPPVRTEQNIEKKIISAARKPATAPLPDHGGSLAGIVACDRQHIQQCLVIPRRELGLKATNGQVVKFRGAKSRGVLSVFREENTNNIGLQAPVSARSACSPGIACCMARVGWHRAGNGVRNGQEMMK